MGRRRAASRKNWPKNLYPNRDGFKYRHPVTGKEHWFGYCKKEAFEAARQLNDLLMPGQVDEDFVARVLGNRTSHLNPPRPFNARHRVK